MVFYTLLIYLSRVLTTNKLKTQFIDILSNKYDDSDFFAIKVPQLTSCYLIVLGTSWIHISMYENFEKKYEKIITINTKYPLPLEYNATIIEDISKVFSDTKPIFIDHKFGCETEFVKYLMRIFWTNKAEISDLSEFVLTDKFNGTIRLISDDFISISPMFVSDANRKERYTIISTGILIYINIEDILCVFKIEYSHLKNIILISEILNVDEHSNMKWDEKIQYLQNYLDIPLLRKIYNSPKLRNDICPIEKSLMIQRYELNSDRPITLFCFLRDIWDMKSDLLSTSYVSDPLNCLLIFYINETVIINGIKVSLLEKEDTILLSVQEMEKICFLCDLSADMDYFIIDYIMYILKESSILNKAVHNIMNKSRGLYIVFVQALFFCEVITREEMENIKEFFDNFESLNILLKLRNENTIFNHKYGRLLRLIIYVEVNSMWEEFNQSLGLENDYVFFRDTREALKKLSNYEYNKGEEDLSSLIKTHLIKESDMFYFNKIYDSCIDKIMPDVVDELKKMITKNN